MDFLAGFGLRIGQGLDFEQDLLGRDALGQFGDNQLPLAAGQILDHPAGAQLEAAAAGFVGLADVGLGRNDLAAAGEVRPGDVRHQIGHGGGGVFDGG